MIASLASNPQVAYISPNRPTSSLLDVTAQTVNADQVWSEGWTGTGVGVAVIDSGVALKQDLAASDGSHSRVVFSESFVAGQDASDQYGHGTHVAGIVAANGAQSTGPNFTQTFKGVAPNANIVNLACAGRQRQRPGIGRDRGHRRSHRAEGQIQHPSD